MNKWMSNIHERNYCTCICTTKCCTELANKGFCLIWNKTSIKHQGNWAHMSITYCTMRIVHDCSLDPLSNEFLFNKYFYNKDLSCRITLLYIYCMWFNLLLYYTCTSTCIFFRFRKNGYEPCQSYSVWGR